MMRALVVLACLVPAHAFAAEPQVSPILYLNRCEPNCVVKSGVDDARAMTSSIPCPGGGATPGGDCSSTTITEFTIEPFKNSAGLSGSAADAEWQQLMTCVREVYSPYAIEVTDQLPPGGLSHNLGIVAGKPSNIGWSGIGGIAPGTSCNPRDNVISFTFSNIYGGSDRINEICATVAQETAHAYGLDHAYAFSDGRSACPDPMSYRSECGGRRFFRNDNATCGEFAARPCQCGGFQNSHLKILAIFGPGTPITPAPALSVSAPTAGAMISNGTSVIATASAPRGVFRLELWLNGYKWTTVKGAPFGSTGQPEMTYALVMPAMVPDGVIDIVVKAYDDIEVMTESAPITVTKGAPCVDASSCATGQKCDAGKCYWDTPTGQLGDRCEYQQFCVSEQCIETSDGKFCSDDCVVGVADSCPMGYECQGAAGQTGYCISESLDPGCCSVGSDGRAAGLLALVVLGGVLRRRRRR
jgi:MYXO-CTERM domain-containing protein